MSYKYIDENREHLHTLDERPLIGTSSAMDVIAKVLTWWASGMAMNKMGWTNSKLKDPITKKYKSIPLDERVKIAQPVLDQIKGMNVETYLSFCDEAYKAHSVKLKDSAQAGTDLHAELERFVKNEMEGKTSETYEPRIEPFIEWARKNVKRYLWSEGNCYSRVLWVGGISDVGAELMDGSIAIIDFKSAKEAYATHFFQIAGYDLEITENGWFDKDGKQLGKLPEGKEITKHIVVPFGGAVVVPEVSDKVLAHREAFKHALGLYKIMQSLGAI